MRDGQPVIAGLPWKTWFLAAAATLPGLFLALAFYRSHRNEPPEFGPGAHG